MSLPKLCDFIFCNAISVMALHVVDTIGVVMKQVIAILNSVPDTEVSQLIVRASYCAFQNRCRRNNDSLLMEKEVGSWLDGGSPTESILVSSVDLEEIYEAAINTTLCPSLVRNEAGELIAVAMGPYSAGSLACALPRLTRKEHI